MMLADTVPSVLRTLTGNAVLSQCTAALLSHDVYFDATVLVEEFESLAPFRSWGY
jgi:hypothetical protein